VLRETLGGLVDKSVMLAGADVDGRRYRLLDTLAEYGRERLCDPATARHRYGVDEPMLRRRHRDFYLELAERFHADWFGPRQVAWSRRMRAELDNLRAALGYCLNAGDARVGVRLAGALHYLWYGCGEAREGRLWLERVLVADPHPSRELIRALAARARIALLQGEHETAADLARAGLEQARRFDEPRYVAEALTMLGIDALHRGDPAAEPLRWTRCTRRSPTPRSCWHWCF
jgi:non-specific serine/threonine protein kinase